MTGLPVTDAVLRDAVRKRVDESSYRAVADEIGMSFSNVGSFLRGARPQRATREKLIRWYYGDTTGAPEIPHEDFETAMALVLSYLRDESKPRAVRERQRREAIGRISEEG